MTGFYPRHLRGRITGRGLSLIMIIKSSLNVYTSLGNAHTLISYYESLAFNDIVSGSTLNIPYL